MEKRSYVQLLADLFDYLVIEWGYINVLKFSDEEGIHIRHNEGYMCYQLDPKSFNGQPHTLGLKKINSAGWIGPEGLSMAYWTHTPLFESEPCLVITAEKRPDDKAIVYLLKIQKLESYGTRGGFAFNWIGADQVLSIIDRTRALLSLGEYVDSVAPGSIEDIVDFTVQDNFTKRS